MSDVWNHHEVTVSLMDDPPFGVNLDVPYMDDADEPTGETYNAGVKLDVPRGTEDFTVATEEFFLGLRQYFRNNLGRKLQEDEENEYRQVFSAWNTFLQSVQGGQHTSAIISSNIKEDIKNFISWLADSDYVIRATCSKRWIKRWLPDWNMFLQARAGETLVTRLNFYFTIVGLLLYIIDQGSDVGTAIFFASNGQWWQAVVTITIVYGTVFIYTGWKLINEQIHCTGLADWLRYVASLLVNWPDLEQYGALCLLEWKLHKSPVQNAPLVPEWSQRRYSIAYLKFTEGLWEACPQAILQLYLLVPDLYGDLTWTDYPRIASVTVSLCTAGAVLVNCEKYYRINNNIELPLSELIVLYVWAVPVAVSGLLSMGLLLLVVNQYWALTFVTAHHMMYCIYWFKTVRVPRVSEVNARRQGTLMFLISPFDVAWSFTYRRVLHAMNFLRDAIAMMLWALETPLESAHPALYTAIICFNAVMIAVGLVGWQLHEKYWPGRYC